MKKLALLTIALLLVVTISAENLEALKDAHMNAMKYNGQAARLQERSGEMYFATVGTTMASMFADEDIITGYLEKSEKKIYWEVTPIEGGVKITITVNVLGQTFTKSIIIKLEGKALTVVDESEDRYDWMCLVKCVGGKVFECLDCLTDWKCWGNCAGADAVNCVMGCF